MSPSPSNSKVPPLVWPAFADDKARLDWWRACVQAYDETSNEPVRPQDLEALEQRLGFSIPPLLRTYHEQIGALDLVEALCSVTPAEHASIEPLIDAFPGIVTFLEDAPNANKEWALVNQLVVFGDSLGDGNLWCFHQKTGEVWYFDHDTPPMLTRIFDDVSQYLDVLMFTCLLDVHGEEDNEDLLRKHLGDAVVEKWMY